ncbi:hypothetical protein NST62_10440 [Ureibacillus sp. FSL K6-8385]|uniref:hypothetical protein n=1 Tax=Ureibacillus sp. FSL K6-8385 TaxID=2954684 RepID=UPI0031585FEA
MRREKSFIEKWFKQGSYMVFIGFAEYVSMNEMINISFKHILQLEDKNLKPFTRDLLHLLEEIENDDEVERNSFSVCCHLLKKSCVRNENVLGKT